MGHAREEGKLELSEVESGRAVGGWGGTDRGLRRKIHISCMFSVASDRNWFKPVFEKEDKEERKERRKRDALLAYTPGVSAFRYGWI